MVYFVGEFLEENLETTLGKNGSKTSKLGNGVCVFEFISDKFFHNIFNRCV
jgi:hypothetical protein